MKSLSVLVILQVVLLPAAARPQGVERDTVSDHIRAKLVNSLAQIGLTTADDVDVFWAGKRQLEIWLYRPDSRVIPLQEVYDDMCSIVGGASVAKTIVLNARLALLVFSYRLETDRSASVIVLRRADFAQDSVDLPRKIDAPFPDVDPPLVFAAAWESESGNVRFVDVCQ